MADLRVELLYAPGCPHWEQVRTDLHQALSEGAIETPIQLVLVSSQEDAEFLGFPGSPTVRLNGVDVAPEPPSGPPGTSCRMYRQPDGTLGGGIPAGLLREAVRSHRRDRLAAFQRGEAAKVALAALEAVADEVARPGNAPKSEEE
ncbi:MAG: DF family (seleno)protein [Candidatus Limnocylindrales bacterium]